MRFVELTEKKKLKTLEKKKTAIKKYYNFLIFFNILMVYLVHSRVCKATSKLLWNVI